MKRSFLILVLAALSNSAICQDTWIQRDSVNGPPKSVGAVFSVGDDAYFLTGLDEFGFKRSMYSYDIDQDDWDDELHLGGETGDGLNRGSAIAFAVGGFGFCGLGTGSADYFRDLWQYDIITKVWTQMADFGGTGRREAVSFVVGDFAYVGTGQTETGLTNDFWKYDYLTNSWTEITAFPGTPRRDAVGISMGGQGYVGTGVDAATYKKDFWAYSPSSDTWLQKADFPGTPRHGAVGFGLFPSAFIGLGEDNTFTYKNDFWEYNYFADVWIQRSNLPAAGRAQAIAIVVEGRAYVGTGYNGILFDDFWEYTPILSVDEEITLHANLFPNPTSLEFFIEFSDENNQLSFKIFNQLGQEMTNEFDIQKEANGRFHIFVNDIPKGVYHVYLQNNIGNRVTKSVLIQ